MRRPIFCFSLALFAFLLNLISRQFPRQLLTWYSHGVNSITVQWLSRLTGLVPFSIFEWLIYSLMLALIIYIVVSIFKCLDNWRASLRVLGKMFINILSVAALLYAIFILLWGLNYNRPPLADVLELEVSDRSVDDLKALYRLLIERANSARLDVMEDENGIFTANQHYSEIFARAPLGFDAVSESLPALGGRYGLPKAIMISPLMNYTSITGIYSPFTGEANVNVAVPDSTLMFTTLHEMAHQRGIAREDEANFIAFLTSIKHPDADFRYVGYLRALNYTRSALRRVAAQYLPELNALLSDEVIADIMFVNEFWQQFESPIEEIFTQMNESYLRFNGIEEGVGSYGLVVDLLLAYFADALADYQ